MLPQGVLTALITLLDERGELDAPVLRRLVQQSIHAGIHGVVFWRNHR